MRFGVLKLINHRQMRSAAEPYLQQLGLNPSADTLLNQMPIAQQKMVEVAKALLLEE